MLPADIFVRTATPADDALVSELLQASYPVLMRPSYEGDVLAAALPLMTRADPALLSSGTFYLVKIEDGRVVGCGGWTRERPGSGEVAPELAHIRYFAVHPERNRCGVGRAIYAKCEEKARSAGVRRFECCSSLNAEGFYAALGFRTVRAGNVAHGPRCEDTVHSDGTIHLIPKIRYDGARIDLKHGGGWIEVLRIPDVAAGP